MLHNICTSTPEHTPKDPRTSEDMIGNDTTLCRAEAPYVQEAETCVASALPGDGWCLFRGSSCQGYMCLSTYSSIIFNQEICRIRLLRKDCERMGSLSPVLRAGATLAALLISGFLIRKVVSEYTQSMPSKEGRKPGQRLGENSEDVFSHGGFDGSSSPEPSEARRRAAEAAQVWADQDSSRKPTQRCFPSDILIGKS